MKDCRTKNFIIVLVLIGLASIFSNGLPLSAAEKALTPDTVCQCASHSHDSADVMPMCACCLGQTGAAASHHCPCMKSSPKTDDVPVTVPQTKRTTEGQATIAATLPSHVMDDSVHECGKVAIQQTIYEYLYKSLSGGRAPPA